MPKINIRKTYYHVTHRYLTMNNIVIGIALVIAASWTWGSIGVMQRNYELQKEIDGKRREQKLIELEAQNLAYQQKYYQSSEYQELAIRSRLGLANPGEKALILPPNSAAAKDSGKGTAGRMNTIEQMSNFQQWMNFLFRVNRL